MAHFMGTVQGQRGEASRLGSRASGLRTVAASWQGAIAVELYVSADGNDYARVCIEPWQGAGSFRMLWEGPLATEATRPAVRRIVCPPLDPKTGLPAAENDTARRRAAQAANMLAPIVDTPEPSPDRDSCGCRWPNCDCGIQGCGR